MRKRDRSFTTMDMKSMVYYESITYTAVSHCRGGGVATFISDTLELQVLLSGNNGLEVHLVSVYDASKPTQKPHVGVWYRPPHDREAIFLRASMSEFFSTL